MLKGHVVHLCCPACHSDLLLEESTEENGQVKEGKLTCSKCSTAYPVVRFIPRFVPVDDNYASSFGFEWNKHYCTQYDRYCGANISEERFFNETKWSRALYSETILEAGSGSGRFTEHAASTGATVVSFDYSNAVEANYFNNSHLENLLIVQADIYNMPFRDEYFDKIFCFGVLQHTPSPDRSFFSLVGKMKKGGHIVVDVYRAYSRWKHIYQPKYWVRPVTKRLPHRFLYKLCEGWVNFWWPITGAVHKLTGRHSLSWYLLVADYRGEFPLPDRILKEWAVLDTFDMLSPVYDLPQTIETVADWFARAGMTSVDVKYGYNGIEGRGVSM